MNRTPWGVLILVCTLALAGCDSAVVSGTNEDLDVASKKADPTTIQGGQIVNGAGEVIRVGYDIWGYNYQARMFNGKYCDAYRNAAWCQAYKNDNLQMKWNDAWLSNRDMDGDHLLDRHYGLASYRGSGAWLTNHMSGEYQQAGATCKWTYFTKIVAAPSDATLIAGSWVLADGTVMGPAIWGDFAIIQEVTNDGCAGLNGLQLNSEAPTGFGFYN